MVTIFVSHTCSCSRKFGPVLDFQSQPPTMLSYERVFSPIMVRELLTRNDRNSKASGQNNMSING